MKAPCNFKSSICRIARECGSPILAASALRLCEPVHTWHVSFGPGEENTRLSALDGPPAVQCDHDVEVTVKPAACDVRYRRMTASIAVAASRKLACACRHINVAARTKGKIQISFDEVFAAIVSEFGDLLWPRCNVPEEFEMEPSYQQSYAQTQKMRHASDMSDFIDLSSVFCGCQRTLT